MSRAGRLDCVCGPLAGASARNDSDTWRLTIGFGVAVLAQALTLAAVPVASASLAPQSANANLPYALTLFGAAVASLPASMLLDQFGRRAAFTLGACLGLSGGLLAAFAIATRQFSVLCVGALWIGVAQGFALFYRHAAASAQAGGSRAALITLAGGCAASVLAPGIVTLCQKASGPLADYSLMLAIGFISVAALPFLLTLPHSLIDQAGPPNVRAAKFWQANAVVAVAWFVMARAMAGAPVALAGCGLGAAAIAGFVSWHLLAMYGPFALASRYVMPTRPVLAAGGALLALSILLPRSAPIQIEAALLTGGTGWSLVQIGASRLLYDDGWRSRLALGLHDTLILGAALAGALSAGL